MKKLLSLFVVGVGLSFVQRADAVAIYALTQNNEIMVVDGTVPQNILSFRAITGLAPTEKAIGIDGRPADGKLYALTASPDASNPPNFNLTPRIFTVDANTGVATLVAALSPDPADMTAPLYTGLSGTHFAIDFNPQADRLRIVSETGQNLRVNIGAANALVSADINLAYAAPLGQPPKINAIAYSNNNAGVGSTRLFDIDDANFKIVEQSPPNNGVLIDPEDFGAPNADHPGFDIAPDGTGYLGGHHNVSAATEEWILATLDPLNYDAITNPGESHGPIGDGKIPIQDIAVATSISFSAPLYSIFEGSAINPAATITVTRHGFLNQPVTVQYTTLSDTASAGSDYATASGTVTFNMNEITKTFQVPIFDEVFPEDDEFLDLALTSVTGPAVLGPPGSARLRINANDRIELVGPQVLFTGLTGPSRGIDGAVIFFNEDMDPASVANLDNYVLSTVSKAGKVSKVTFDSAVYDPVERKVTLGLNTGFEQTKFVRMALRVIGHGANGVRDVNLNKLDGNRDRVPGGDAVQAFTVFSAASETPLKFIDRDGDAVKLTLTGGGQLDGVIPTGGPKTQRTQFWILDPIALQTTLQGKVTKSPRGDGIVVIAEIIGLDKKEFTPIATNPAFRINRLTFSSNATGLGLP